ncbi:MAG TPA: energy transducer TonB [Stellaceae bacterium]|nr:energy transducer TonB [Stellaceae bacterium]
MNSPGGSSPASLAPSARQRFRVITGGRAHHTAVVIPLFAPSPDDEPEPSSAPESILRSPLARAVLISAALHLALLALIVMIGIPESMESAPISVTLVWAPAPQAPAAPATEAAAAPAAPEAPAEAVAAAAPPPPVEKLAALAPAAEPAPEKPMPPPPPHRPPAPPRAAASEATASHAPAAAAPPMPSEAAAPAAGVAAPPASAQVAALPLIPPRPVSGAAGNAKPLYPAAARRLGIQGKVILQVEVSPEGTPAKVTVLTSSGHAALDEAAVTAVGKWRFVPASRGGTAVAATAEIPIEFRLAD